MSSITRCPQCGTHFKVSQAQLEAHQGMVRCGCCQAIFNAEQSLDDGQPSPQLSLPIAPEEGEQPALLPDTNPDAAVKPDLPAPALTPAAQISVLEEAYEEPGQSAAAKRHWPWVIGALLLLLALLAQAGYFFRVELAARLPGLKPLLASYCDLLKCAIPLPQKADLLSIESSELEASPAQASSISLNAILRNRAPYTQAYPNLELTLTDMTDTALARRTFHPAEYLKPGEDEKQGLAASREISIRLNLDTTDLKPAGYRLLLFYPS